MTSKEKTSNLDALDKKLETKLVKKFELDIDIQEYLEAAHPFDSNKDSIMSAASTAKGNSETLLCSRIWGKLLLR